MLKKGKFLSLTVVTMMLVNAFAAVVNAEVVKQPVSGKSELKLNPTYWDVQLKTVSGTDFVWTDDDYSVNICDTDGVGDNSSLAIAISAKSTSAQNIIVRNTLKENIPQGSTFKFEFDYKVGNKDNFNTDIYGRDFQGAVYGLVGSNKVEKTDIGNGWVHYTGYMTDTSTNGNPISWIYLRNNIRPTSEISFLLDNLSVKVVTTPASEGVDEVLGDELIQDGDFNKYVLDATELYKQDTYLKPNTVRIQEDSEGYSGHKGTMAYSKNGDASLVLHHEKSTNKKQQYVYFKLNDAMTNATDYVVEYSVAGKSDQSRLQLGFVVGGTVASNLNWGYAAGTKGATNGIWTTYTKEFTTTKDIAAGSEIRLFQTQYSNQTDESLDYLLDDVKLYAKNDANKTNLLVDGSIENHNVDVAEAANGLAQYNAVDWDLAYKGANAADDAKLSVVNGYAQDGNSALYAHYTMPKASGNAALFAKGQLTDLKASKTYVIEYKVAGTKDNDKYVKAGFGYGNQGTTENGAKRGFVPGTLISDGIWRTYQVEVTTGSDAKEGAGKYQLITVEGTASADILLDNIKVYDKADESKTNLLVNGSFELLTRDYSQAQLVDADGEPVEGIVQGLNYVKVDPKYSINSDGKYEGVVIVALYNNNAFVTANITRQLTNTAPQFEETTVSLNLEDEIKPEDNYTIKVFYWNNLTDMTPISSADVMPAGV